MGYDVAVIGGGAAGLVAALRIAAAGRTVVLLEARDRLGGRIFTTDGVELGAEFVHGRPESTLSWAREAGLKLIPAEGEQWIGETGRLSQVEDRFAGLQWLIAKARRIERDMPAAAFLGQFRNDPRLSDTAKWARRLVEGFDAADPARASLKAIIQEWTGSAGVQSHQARLEHGYGGLVTHLANRLPATVDLRLRTRVRAVEWETGRVVVGLDHQSQPSSVAARAAVVTLPLGVLQAPARDPAAVRFTPDLVSKAAAFDGLVMGSVLKVILRFKQPFWRSIEGGKYRKAAFFFRSDGHFPTFWTALPARHSNLNAWYGGPGSALLSREAPEVIIGQAVESLQSLFGAAVPVRELLDKARVHNWQGDPFSRGGYSYLAVGGSGARSALARPVDETLFFAGEATDDEGEACTVAGALASGERAAREVVAALQ